MSSAPPHVLPEDLQRNPPETVGLFIPCYIDQLKPEVGRATVALLEKLGVDVVFPFEQTCCGQPMANSGCRADAAPLARRFVEIFAQYDAVVCPSGSCTAMVRHHYHDLIGDMPGYARVRERTFELCEFMTDVLHVESVDAAFPHRVGLHQSCHGLRELRLGAGSERVIEPFSKVRPLLASVRGIELVGLHDDDECCGFGGMFAIGEEAVACAMGRDRLADHAQARAEVITATDISCLLHLEGLALRAKSSTRFMHVAEILAGDKMP